MLSRTVEAVVAGWALLGGVALLAITAVTTLNVGALILDRLAALAGADVAGLPGYEDFVRVTVSCAALSFFPYCQLRRGHVAVTLFTDRLPQRGRDVLSAIWLATTVGTALFLAWWMAVGLAEARGDAVLTPILGWSIWPFYLPGLVSLLLWALVAGLQIREGAAA